MVTLSSQEIKLVRKFWAVFEEDSRHHFVEIFVRVLTEYPRLHAKFPRFGGVDPVDMRRSVMVRAHACRILATIRSIVLMLEDDGVVEGTLFLLADTHIRQNAVIEDFQKFRTVMLAYLVEVFDEDMDADLLEAVGRMMTMVVEKMDLTMRMAMPPSTTSDPSGEHRPSDQRDRRRKRSRNIDLSCCGLFGEDKV